MSFNYYLAIKPLIKLISMDKKDAHNIFISLPHLKTELSLTDFKNTLINLGVETNESYEQIKSITSSQVPVIAILKNDAYIISIDENNNIKSFNLNNNEEIPLKKIYRKKALILKFKLNNSLPEVNKNWFKETLKRFTPFFFKLMTLGFVTSILGLASPLFLRSIYDWVIPTESEVTLYYFSFGLALTFLIGFVIHYQKSKILSYVGARLNMIISTEVLKKLMYLPNNMVEGVKIGDQVARLKQFDGVRELFTGSIAQTIVDIPFTLIFFFFLAYIGGVIITIPIIMSLIFVLLIFIFTPIFQKTSKDGSRAFITRQSFLVESFSKIDTITRIGAVDKWNNKFQDITKDSSKTQSESEYWNQFASNASHFIIKSGGIITIIWCAIIVINGDMTTGTLLAIILLVWRALSPFQSLFMTLSRWHILKSSVLQINSLLSLPQTTNPSQTRTLDLTGHVLFQNVGFRYPNQKGAPSINNVTMEARPGEIVGVIGGNGSGKSTLVKLLLGLHNPQMGKISIDGKDISLYDGSSLRQSISYAPHNTELFHGSIAQNLRLVKSQATMEELENVCDLAGVLDDIKNLPNGMNEIISDEIKHKFSFGFRQKINIARAYLRDGKIMIFDEPGNALDINSDAKIRNYILKNQGKKTFIIITHRPSLINICNRILVLDEGNMRVFGPNQKVMEFLKSKEEAA